MTLWQLEHLSVVPCLDLPYGEPTSHLLCLVFIISGSRLSAPLSFTARTHTQTLMLTRMMSRENSLFKHLQDWILGRH